MLQPNTGIIGGIQTSTVILSVGYQIENIHKTVRLTCHNKRLDKRHPIITQILFQGKIFITFFWYVYLTDKYIAPINVDVIIRPSTRSKPIQKISFNVLRQENKKKKPI